MKIMFVIATNLSGGAERVISVLSNCFVKTHEVVLVNFDVDSHFYELDKRIHIIKLGQKNPRVLSNSIIVKLPNLVKEIRTIINEHNPDVVIPFLFNAELPTYIACHMTKTNCITSVRNSPRVYPLYQRLIRKIVFKRIAGVVFQSETVRKHPDFRKVRNSIVIMNPLGYDTSSYNDSKVKGKIISVGRLSEQKNHEMTIKAFSQLSDKYPFASLHIFGGGPQYDYLNNLINSLNLRNRIKLEGVVNNAILLNNDAAFFVMSSNYEGFPNALAEAMACGIPVISTDFDSGVAKELIGDDSCGLLVETNNTNDLASKMMFYLDNPQEAVVRSRRAQDKCKCLNPDLICEQWITFIRTCCL